MIVQMHKVLIPYFIALSITPPTHSLEGTLLVCSLHLYINGKNKHIKLFQYFLFKDFQRTFGLFVLNSLVKRLFYKFLS